MQSSLQSYLRREGEKKNCKSFLVENEATLRALHGGNEAFEVL